ncbi:GGDEF domain-containing protein [Lacimicrobium alkaliphilum]|uniref:diguanylate cyclase n=1 Tax=Lacimicrobium alkaliphilum TaxID=1526571 RepID=A0ABQ1RG86_9ALTE|nr:GGDEF domain-containing protein [Lacimicrobium alkaliphilum]GGD66985.1 diguanylate cyclase [Lacimicrobium alkaliphilum]
MDNGSQVTNTKLDLTNQNQQKVLRSFKHQIDTLSQFILRLSKFYEGAVPALDKELQTLRGHLGGKINFTLAEVSVGKLTALLMENSDQVRLQNQKSHNLIENAIQSLQENNGLPEALKEDAQAFLRQVRQSQASVFTSLPHFEKALELFQKALINFQARKAEPPPGESLPLQNATLVLHKEITDELRELVSQLTTSAKEDPQLKKVRDQLAKGLDHEQLLECCLIIIRTILREVIHERKHAERFVSSLHSTLDKVSQSVTHSIEKSESTFQLKTDNTAQLKQQVLNIEVAIDEAENIKLLRKQAGEYLAKIAATIDTREKADQDEQRVLMKLLNEMRDQLSHLEQETSEYKQRLLQQKYRSHHDELTQIPNRSAYNDRIELEYRRWRRYGTELSMALVDVDHFKTINDNYGHAAGDKTLQVIAQQMSKCLRSTDFLARWGGEEFVLLFPQTSEGELEAALEKVRLQIAKIPFRFKQQSVKITVSIGAASFIEGDDVHRVFERADRALYTAKTQGRNRSVIDQGKK